MPEVSVLMPIYKTTEAYLREAIESILNQTFTDFEFLILDDCPEDSRESVVKSYRDNRIKYMKNKENLGISQSRNKLIECATGEYLAIFDHDDICLPQRLEKEVSYLKKNFEVGVCGSWCMYIPRGKIIKFPKDDYEIKKLLMRECSIAHSSVMIRKSILTENKLCYEEEYTPSEDLRLFLKLIKVTSFHNIQEVLLKYRQYDKNTSFLQKTKMDKVTNRLRSMAEIQYPFLYQSYIKDRTKLKKILLLGFLPILTLRQDRHTSTILLFNVIPLVIIKNKILPWIKYNQ